MTDRELLKQPREPYGHVTTHTVTGQQFFYRHPEPPYLDTAKECIAVYAAPQAQPAPAAPAVPLTDKFTLPPLPQPTPLKLKAAMSDDDVQTLTYWARETALAHKRQIQDRDREVAKCVLEAVAKVCEIEAQEAYKRYRSEGHTYDDGCCDMANTLKEYILTLKVSHD